MSGTYAWLTPDNYPAEEPITRGMTLPEDQEWLAPLSGALLDLADPDNWEAHGSVTPGQAAEYYRQKLVQWWTGLDVTPAQYPQGGTVLHGHGAIQAGNPFTLVSIPYTNAHPLHTAWFQNAPALSDIVHWWLPLAAGQYIFHSSYVGYPNRGQVSWRIGAPGIGIMEMYAAGVVYNAEWTHSCNVYTDGVHRLEGWVTGKHASSSSYWWVGTCHWFEWVGELP